MPGSNARQSPWWPLYRADRDAGLLSRVRITAGLVLVPAVVMTAYQVVRDPTTTRARVLVGAAFAAQLAVAWLFAWLPVGRRHAMTTALVFALGLIAVAATAWRVLPPDESMALHAIAIMMGLTFLMPWGSTPQAVVCAATVVGYGWAMLPTATGPGVYALFLMIGLGPIMTIGAGLFEESRRHSFARAWQSEQLATLARELAAHVHEEALVERVLDLGGRLVGADWASALLYDRTRGTFTVEAIRGASVEQTWVGVEVPTELTHGILARGRLVLPDDDPTSPAITMLAQDGVRHALYILMRHGDEVVGILGFARRHAVPFTAGDQALVRAIADQAGVGLRTGELVQDLRRANSLKSQFVSTMSHELRTPLNVILGFAEIAQDASIDEAERVECLQRIATAGADLLELINSTLEIGRSEAADAVRMEPVALDAFWDETRAACERLPRSPTVELAFGAPAAAVVESDPRKLSVILRNLVGNALKFTESGSVRVEVALADDRLVFTVADTGIGIRAEDQEAVFEMFRQADGSDSRRYGGTGLGLYIVRRFAAQLDGAVALASEPGVGSTFTVSLPVARRCDERAA
jgi:signal transduction histidine kinase